MTGITKAEFRLRARRLPAFGHKERWLAKHLRERRSALVCVTHDRWFLDQVCTRMWDVQRGDVYEYEGGYSDYVFARAERERIAATEETKRQNLVRKELAWLRRGAP
ncbi:hypothetical protein ACQKJN_13180, partial [Staphylococcus saprophyticus]